MVRMPLTLIWWYNSERKLYEHVGTHHTITIKQFEQLERERNELSDWEMKLHLISFGVFMFVLFVIFIVFICGGFHAAN